MTTIGKLVVINNKSLQVQFTNSKGNQVNLAVKESELSAPLMEKKKKAIAQLNGLEVELEEVGGQPKQVREKGKSFASHQLNTVPTSSSRPSVNNTPMGDFHNPYNFVPALPRNTNKVQSSELGDRTPTGHGSYQDGYWSGKISVSLTTVTPLLIPDAANATGDDHKTYPIRLGSDGKPYLPPTSIKGMLRSAYEAVTNSRLSIFSKKYENQLFYRMGAGEGLSLVPARIEGDRVKLLFGTTSDIPQWNGQRWQIPRNEPMYAAWLPRYRQNSPHNLQYPGMKHGDRVKVWLELYQKQTRDGRVIFKYWLVRQIIPFEQSLDRSPPAGSSYGSHVPAGQPMIEADGYVCITNKNIENKHDERVFFTHNNSTHHSESFAHLNDNWEYLINNYQEIHQNESREDNLEWSRHVLGGDKEHKLADGTLCYAYVEKNSQQEYEIKHLYPVMISRATFNLPPSALLSSDGESSTSEKHLDLHKLK
ncbi:MAG TPA: TIGR03986 family CRISPR-associated RAMP protein, partial [Cyanobacteria bacterium UBA11162]|nr:TIGR03986 family CRISPR-associated RAMP protein [Cyanobacteria bacterium UBA11162]